MLILGFITTDLLHESRSSIVHRAEPLDGTASVVLKMLKGEHPSPQRLARFRREFEMASLFQSERILKVLRQERHANTLVSIVEDFGADSLSNGIEHAPPTLREALIIGIALCDGLFVIHNFGIIHKNITPSNILWNRATSAVKITGFGIAAPIERTTAVPQASAVLEGTLSSMSPEQTGRMNRPVDYRSDFYSLGVTLYELFTGEKPFASEDPLELIHCHIAQRPLPPANRRSKTPEALSDIVLKLMEKNAEDRYQSIEALKADLVECLRQWDASGTIVPFPPTGHDVSSRFQLSARLYGRGEDVSLLCDAFEGVLAGELAFTMVKGHSGVGKSALVQELYRPLAVARGRYITGKYDQYQRSVPYSALGIAFNSFCDQLLCESPDVVQTWRQRILNVVGRNGEALIEVIPRLKNLIGPQPALPEREPQAAQSLLKQLCQDFVQEICRPEEPLVLFLDDLQWADVASLSLLEKVLTSTHVRGLHLVGAYRDNEVDSAHPLVLMLDGLATTQLAFATIHLDNMSYDNVAALVSDTLSLTVADVSELAHIIYEKTYGNAFFTVEFLRGLHADQLLQFDHTQRRWTWDAAGIHAKQITGNVVTLMAGRITQLPAPTQTLLKLAACIGNQFRLQTLAVIGQIAGTQTEIIDSLTPALRLGVVVSGENARKQSRQSGVDAAPDEFRFQHDRVQQAAYSLIPEADRPAMHLHIARRLSADANQGGGGEDNLFEIVSHFNKGMSCIKDRAERLQVAGLNLQAGMKARKASAHHAAWDFFRGARELLPPDSFETAHDLAFPIHLSLAKSSYVAGRYDEADAIYPLLLQRARGALEKSQVHLVQMEDYHLRGAYATAIEVQTINLSLLGEQVPASEIALAQAIDHELALTPGLLGSRRVADLIGAPEIERPEIVATLKTLMGLWISAHLISNEPMVQWSSLRLANLSLKHGNSELAAFAFLQYGYICITRLQRFEEGYEYGTLALRLADRYDNLGMRGKIYFLFGMCISPWKEHVSLATASMRNAYAFSVEDGDWTYAVYAACNIVSNLIIAGVHCDEIAVEAEQFLEFLKDKATTGLASFFLPGGVCALLNLQGKTNSRDSFSCQHLDERVFLETQATLPTIEGWFYVHKIRSRYLFRYFESSSLMLAQTELAAAALRAQIRIPELYFYSCLILAATDDATADSDTKGRIRSAFDRYEKQMGVWAEHCPENYFHKYSFIKGERARLEGAGLDEVLGWYDKGIQSARECQFPNSVALGYELKARFWLERRQKAYAMNDLKEAHYGYRLWGAAGKVAMLEEEHGELSARTADVAALTPDQLDLLSVHKASRAISDKLEVGDLIETLMMIVMESAGADRGVLLLEKNGEWQIAACADLGSKGIAIGFPAEPRDQVIDGGGFNVPSSVINYALRTQALVAVSEPVRDLRFGQDAYITRVVPRSVLCVPVINQGRTIAIIYLENKLGPNVFSPDRRDLIDVLAGQIATSLENARLYADLKATVAKQEQMMRVLAAQQAELEKTNTALVKQKTQLSEQAMELRTRNEEISRVSLQRKLAEEATSRLNAELEQRVQERTIDLQRSNKELEQFAYVASHDLQEPLRKIGSFAQLLNAQYRGKLDADADEFIGYMVDGARRMQLLIQNLLAYSRLGRKGQPFALADGNAVLNQSLRNLAQAIEDSGAIVTSDPLPTMLADEVQLIQLFQNLIGNAIKFSGSDIPRIQIGAAPDGPNWTLSVRDNGIGIDSQFAERIFVIFQRLHRREEYPGTGIGLAFCKKIVERHGGQIWMESQPGRGSTFFFTLPRSIEPKNQLYEHNNDNEHD